MNIDHDTLLTAYLDGELPPGTREGVESALASDPRLAEDLRALTAVRDLIAGLSRPSSAVDLSVAVVAGLGRRRRAFSLPFAVSPRNLAIAFPLRAAALLASAAALVGVLALGLFEGGRGPANKPLVRNGPRPVESRPDDASPVKPVLPLVAVLPRDRADDPVPALGREERQRSDELRSVQNLLDSPALHKVFVVTDVLGGGADERVGEILQNTARRHSLFGRITVAQGIIIDPEHPGKATVYAVVVDDQELGRLRDQLSKAFPTAVTEAPARPEVVTQLADIGQVSVFPGLPVADLIDPKIAEPKRALRALDRKDHKSKALVLPYAGDADPLHDLARYVDRSPTPSPNSGPTPEQLLSGPHPSVIARAAVADAVERVSVEPQPSPPRSLPPTLAEPKAPPGFHVVLVWVASSRARAGG